MFFLLTSLGGIIFIDCCFHLFESAVHSSKCNFTPDEYLYLVALMVIHFSCYFVLVDSKININYCDSPTCKNHCLIQEQIICIYLISHHTIFIIWYHFEYFKTLSNINCYFDVNIIYSLIESSLSFALKMTSSLQSKMNILKQGSM